MAFPRSSLLDSFTRANETPLAGNWAKLNTGSGSPLQNGTLNLTSNQVQNASAGTGAGYYWSIATFAPPYEAAATINAWSTNGTTQGFYVGCGVQSPTSNPSMYMAHIEVSGAGGNVGVARIYRYGGANSWQMDAVQVILPLVAGTSKIGIRVVNRWVEGWLYDSGRGWYRYAAMNDDTNTGGNGGVAALGTGYACMGTLCSATAAAGSNQLDDFYAGSITLPGTNTAEFMSAGGVIRDLLGEQGWQAPPCLGFGGGSGGSGGGGGAGRGLGGQAAGGVAIF